MCGLKQLAEDIREESEKSHPSWVCGLKRTFARALNGHRWVTPFVGVWIETVTRRRGKPGQTVTPFVGVWIETKNGRIEVFDTLSHPSWVCGLKQK